MNSKSPMLLGARKCAHARQMVVCIILCPCLEDRIQGTSQTRNPQCCLGPENEWDALRGEARFDVLSGPDM